MFNISFSMIMTRITTPNLTRTDPVTGESLGNRNVNFRMITLTDLFRMITNDETIGNRKLTVLRRSGITRLGTRVILIRNSSNSADNNNGTTPIKVTTGSDQFSRKQPNGNTNCLINHHLVSDPQCNSFCGTNHPFAVTNGNLDRILTGNNRRNL